ncbi:MAG TPA: GH92 family glycosyl hydrolase [Dongiaceae bacterium]|nr:GH92 family glycosyl hydrolase [Dongiaceae bacterium]
MKKLATLLLLFSAAVFSLKAEKPLVAYVNPFLGTAPILDPVDIGFTPPWRVWAGLTYPGAALPNGMVQLSPITKFGSGAGYEYENTVIHAFAHSNKGHWNLCYVPVLPARGEVSPDDFGSTFNHTNESAHPGFYQVYLERYGINAELTTTLRCGYHRYTYKDNHDKKLILNLAVSNERVRDWDLKQEGDNVLKGFQAAHETVYFYAVLNHKITGVQELTGTNSDISVVSLADADQPLEMKIGFSYVSIANAKLNLEKELTGKSFDSVRDDASAIWEKLLSKIQVTGGTERQKELFYSCLYRSFLWPVLRSDVNGEFRDAHRNLVKKDFSFYTVPSLWDDYRNKLVLLSILTPDVANDVIQSLVDDGECTGFIPTFFHGDHAAAFIAGAYLRGLRGFDVTNAYHLLLRNATVEGGTRPYISEYMTNGYISTPVVENPNVETKAKAAVTKTLEYAYDDYAVALLAKALNDPTNYDLMMARSHNYTNMFDPATGLMRGRLENGDWVTPFNPQYPYYEYMYREANAWQSSFFAPQDTEGLIRLYPSKAAFEEKLDQLFSIPWNTNYIAMNINSFIGQYCHGNQPDHGFPWLYYWVGKQEKTQAILDEIMRRFYGMGKEGLTLCGMDDAGEMSSWYVFSALGLYTYSPADEKYIVSVPMFDTEKIVLNTGKTLVVRRVNSGRKITGITFNGKPVDGWFVAHHDLAQGGELVITTAPAAGK